MKMRRYHFGVESHVYPFAACGAHGLLRTLEKVEVTCRNCLRVLKAQAKVGERKA